MLYVCKAIGFVDRLDRGLIHIWEVWKCVFAYDPSLTLCGWQVIKIRLLLITTIRLWFCLTAGERWGGSDVEAWSSNKRHRGERCPDRLLPVGLSARACSRNCRHSLPQSALHLLLRDVCVCSVVCSKCSQLATVAKEELLLYVAPTLVHVWYIAWGLCVLHDVSCVPGHCRT